MSVKSQEVSKMIKIKGMTFNFLHSILKIFFLGLILLEL